MKHLAYVTAGTTILALIGFLISSAFSYTYEIKFAQSQEQMDTFAVILVCIVIPVFALTGGVIGHILYRKSQTQTSQ